MAQTRNQLKAKKTKFDEDGGDYSNTPAVINISDESSTHNSNDELSNDHHNNNDNDNDNDNDSDDGSGSDSDEAPEEESTSQAKQALLQREAQLKQKEAETKRIEREKRKQQDLYNQQQQQQKKLKQLQREQLEKSQQPELPDLLPEDILRSLSSGEDSKLTPSVSKHTRLDDNDDSEWTTDLKKQVKLEKLKQLKASNKASIKKGPVHVKVLANNKLGKVPPKSDKILHTRDKWLKRKSLNKR